MLKPLRKKTNELEGLINIRVWLVFDCSVGRFHNANVRVPNVAFKDEFILGVFRIDFAALV